MVLSTAELAEFQAYVTLALVHKYTLTPVVAGSVDAWNMAQPTYPGPAQTDLPCNYLSDGALTTRDKGVTQLDDPTILIPVADTIKVGDKVTNIKDSNNVVVLAGPLYVQYVAMAMGFGPLTNRIATLRGQAPKKY